MPVAQEEHQKIYMGALITKLLGVLLTPPEWFRKVRLSFIRKEMNSYHDAH